MFVHFSSPAVKDKSLIGNSQTPVNPEHLYSKQLLFLELFSRSHKRRLTVIIVITFFNWHLSTAEDSHEFVV